MDMSGPLRMMIVRSSILLLLAALSGCSMLAPTPAEPIETTIPEPAPLPEPVPEPIPEPPPVVEPSPVIPPEPQNIKPLIAVVISDRTPAYVEVSDALDKYLEHHEVYDLSDQSWSHRQAFEAIAESGASAVVAVGLPAAQAAKKFSTVPVVVGQVFNVNDNELLDENVKAVAVLPPMELQIKAWRELDPTLRNVGAILGPGHDDLIAETDEAMAKNGIKFHYAIAETDRENLYLFNRLVRDIDGYILFPDNRILSRNVLSEMMNYASRHRVQVAVFNEPLLEHGATFSSGSMVSDIAATITRVLDEIVRGNFDSVAPLTGLSEINVQTSGATLRKLGLVSDVTETTNTVADNQ
jgi:ABC-type uncharacterized transport system substrate-binding protein